MLFGDFAESQPKDLIDPIGEKEFAEDYGYLSDSDLEDDEDERAPPSNCVSKSGVRPFDSFATPGEEKVGCEVHVEHTEEGKVVKIPDMAFVT